MLLGKFRDDVRDAHGKDTLLPAQRGSQHLPIEELELSDLDSACDSTGTLLSQFEPFMDDPELPELLRDFRDILNAEKAETLRACLASSTRRRLASRSRPGLTGRRSSLPG
jgi:hypothetical protein